MFLGAAMAGWPHSVALLLLSVSGRLTPELHVPPSCVRPPLCSLSNPPLTSLHLSWSRALPALSLHPPETRVLAAPITLAGTVTHSCPYSATQSAGSRGSQTRLSRSSFSWCRGSFQNIPPSEPGLRASLRTRGEGPWTPPPLVRPVGPSGTHVARVGCSGRALTPSSAVLCAAGDRTLVLGSEC